MHKIRFKRRNKEENLRCLVCLQWLPLVQWGFFYFVESWVFGPGAWTLTAAPRGWCLWGSLAAIAAEPQTLKLRTDWSVFSRCHGYFSLPGAWLGSYLHSPVPAPATEPKLSSVPCETLRNGNLTNLAGRELAHPHALHSHQDVSLQIPHSR